MFDEYFNPPTIAVSLVPKAAALRAEVLANSPVSTSIDQDVSSTSIPLSQEHEHSPIISQGFEESPKTPTFHDDPLNESPHEDSTSQGSSSNVRQLHAPLEHLGRWTKDHPIANVIVEPKNFKKVMTEPSWIDAMQEEFMNLKDLKFRNWCRLQRRVYVSFQRIVDHGQPITCVQAQKALYGLKQAPRAWYDMLSSFLISQQFSKGEIDPTLFTRHAGNDILLVQIYVDDIIFASTNIAMCDEFANQMTNKFKMSMMGANVILFRITNISKSQRHLYKPI
ncbi:retrovirus-related pol polyprotein from transposon TNT 1-94 [Tanacetum coccineum]